MSGFSLSLMYRTYLMTSHVKTHANRQTLVPQDILESNFASDRHTDKPIYIAAMLAAKHRKKPTIQF